MKQLKNFFEQMQPITHSFYQDNKTKSLNQFINYLTSIDNEILSQNSLNNKINELNQLMSTKNNKNVFILFFNQETKEFEQKFCAFYNNQLTYPDFELYKNHIVIKIQPLGKTYQETPKLYTVPPKKRGRRTKATINT